MEPVFNVDSESKIYSRLAKLRASNPERVCDAWLEDKRVFLQDMRDGYFEGACLLRYNPLDVYSKENCFWGTKAESYRNLKTKTLYHFDGQTFCSKQAIADHLGVQLPTVDVRVKQGVVEKSKPFANKDSGMTPSKLPKNKQIKSLQARSSLLAKSVSSKRPEVSDIPALIESAFSLLRKQNVSEAVSIQLIDLLLNGDK